LLRDQLFVVIVGVHSLKNLKNKNYIHKVNHSENFVDPNTQIHIQNIDCGEKCVLIHNKKLLCKININIKNIFYYL